MDLQISEYLPVTLQTSNLSKRCKIPGSDPFPLESVELVSAEAAMVVEEKSVKAEF